MLAEKIVLEEQLAIAKEMNEEVEAAQNKVDELNKKIADMGDELLKSLKKIFDEINMELREIDIGAAFGAGKFGEAFDMVQQQMAAQEERMMADRIEQLRNEGKTDKQAEEIAGAEAFNRQRKKEEKIIEANRKAERDNEKANLRMQAKVFGDKEARDKLRAMDNQDFFRDKLQENIQMGMTKEAAIANATQQLDTKMLADVPELKVVADSFRKIGAGGFAAANDPMKLLAERRLETQRLIQKDIADLLQVVKDNADKEEVFVK